ncbi:hypothetical protein A2U01_0064287, partial [Trifolium medium]|nr:hypothetical protein [Trifolium medium]
MGALSQDYEPEMPRACRYSPPKGQSDQKAMRKMMDRLLP